jgi:hypothetical protein
MNSFHKTRLAMMATSLSLLTYVGVCYYKSYKEDKLAEKAMDNYYKAWADSIHRQHNRSMYNTTTKDE